MTTTISRRRFVTGTAGAAAAAVAFRGLTSERALARLAALQDGPVAIDYWHRSNGDTIQEWEKLAAAFNQEYTGRVQVTPIAQGDIQELNQKVRAAAAGGGLPGALMGDDYDITQYAS